jgi:hypothetical protein
MKKVFHALDLIIGISIMILVVSLILLQRIDSFHLTLFIIGCLVGTLWELPLHFAGPRYSDNPIYTAITPFPLTPVLQPLLHCIWDGAIFMIGVWLVEQATPGPNFEQFQWGELLVLIAWGISSAIVVECAGTMGGWVYAVRRWNPVLFRFNGQNITLLPIAIWGLAPVVFYTLALILT